MSNTEHKKLKVAWICHFTNSEVRKKLMLSKKRKYSDFAHWITSLIKEFENLDNITLHIIAPHMGMKRLQQSFKINNINYHFFKPDLPIIYYRWPSFLPIDALTGFLKNRFLVKLLIKKIKPDIVNLHGAENHYYSSTILDVKNLPVYVCIQGIYLNPDRFNHIVKPNKQKIKYERKIHAKFKYFGIFPPFFANLIKEDNENPVFLKHKYILNIHDKNIDIQNKKFDFVYFGRVDDVKGVDKIIEAVGFIKGMGRNVTLNIIGKGKNKYLNHLKNRIEELGLKEYVFFSGHLPTLEEVHKKVKESKVSVFSSRFENFGGALLESIIMEQPVTSTAVGGIPYLNKDEETILLSKYGDIRSLAKNMLILLDDSDFAKSLVLKCKRFVLKEFDNKKLIDRLVKQYDAIIKNYYHNIPIPEELLFNADEFPAAEQD